MFTLACLFASACCPSLLLAKLASAYYLLTSFLLLGAPDASLCLPTDASLCFCQLLLTNPEGVHSLCVCCSHRFTKSEALPFAAQGAGAKRQEKSEALPPDASLFRMLRSEGVRAGAKRQEKSKASVGKSSILKQEAKKQRCKKMQPLACKASTTNKKGSKGLFDLSVFVLQLKILILIRKRNFAYKTCNIKHKKSVQKTSTIKKQILKPENEI